MRDGLVAGAAGAALSGFPSTALTLARRGDVFDSTRAVGRIVVPEADDDDFSLVVAGGAIHVAVSLGWGVLLAALLPRWLGRRTAFAGAVAGLGIAVLDLGVIGRRLPSIRALDPVPEVLDHLAFGAIVGAVLSRRRRAG